MQIILDIEELRSIAGFSSKAAEKMIDANSVLNSVVSQHNWKCPERVTIDERLESIKANASTLSEAFVDYASHITDIANDYTSFVNEQIRMETTYLDEISTLITGLGSGIDNHSVSRSSSEWVDNGTAFSGVLSEIEQNSMDTSVISSLHGSSHAINIIDFSLLTE